MRFLQMMDLMTESCSPEERGSRDRASLYGVFKTTPPLAKHIVYLPLPPRMIDDLRSSYQRKFPQELATLYGAMNGADLFWTSRSVGKFRIPSCGFSIYGVPLSHDRTAIEPFNISVEDLKRPAQTPDSWLKFGSYVESDSNQRLDLFLDTDTLKVFAVERDSKECVIEQTWESLDLCLCWILEHLSK